MIEICDFPFVIFINFFHFFMIIESHCSILRDVFLVMTILPKDANQLTDSTL